MENCDVRKREGFRKEFLEFDREKAMTN